MIESIPTRDGDVVVSHSQAWRFEYLVWPVVDDGQQQPRATVSTIATRGRDAALDMARRLARNTSGAVFVLECDSGAWSTLAANAPASTDDSTVQE
jgi:hypothetical protein